jgi:hypothetical protein
MGTVRAADTIAALHRAETDILAATRQALGQSAALAAELARVSTAFKDGPNASLRGSIRRGERGPWSLFVSAGNRKVFWAGFVEDGTRAHIIRAKLGPRARGPVAPGQSRGGSGRGLLTFQIAGRWISKPFVNHPGTDATHFMRDARDRAETALVRFVEAGINSAIAR